MSFQFIAHSLHKNKASERISSVLVGTNLNIMEVYPGILLAILSAQVVLGNFNVMNELDGYHEGVHRVENHAAKLAPTFEVNLDLDPKQRWTKILHSFDRTMFIKGVDDIIDPILKFPLLINLAEDIAGRLDEVLPEPYADEMRGIAEALSVPTGKVVLINLAYDISAFAGNSFFRKACTSIVTIDANGNLLQGRNLDYDFVPFLSNITITAVFTRNRKVVYTGTTFAGYVGLLTARKPDAFGLTADERDQGSFLDNIFAIAENHWPTLVMARQVVDTAKNYDEALNMLINAKSIAPMYFILGGIKPYEGSIIVHGRDKTVNVTHMQDTDHPWYVVETNYEPWEPPPKSDDRRDAAIRAMTAVGEKNMNAQELYKVLSSPLVFNKNTVYTTIMSVTDNHIYSSMIRLDRPEN